jgi:hypothetical protein
MALLSTMLLAATLGQAPAGGWLDAVPAEADVVLRVRGIEAVRNDLTAMLKAMSPRLGDQAGPALEAMVGQMKEHHGDEVVSAEFLALARGVPPEDPSQPPLAIVLKSSDYEGFLKAVTGNKELKIKHEDAGYDSFDGPMGGTWYAAKGATGLMAFGPDKTLVSGFAKPSGKTAGHALSPAARKQFSAGDVGIYVNIAALASRYAEQIDQGKQAMLAALDQAPPQAGNAGMMETIKTMYAGMFDSIKDADSLAVSLDFSAAGLGVDGSLTVKPTSGAAKAIATFQPGDTTGVGKLPADAAYYTYMDLDAKTFQSLQLIGFKMMSPGGKAPPEIEAAVTKEIGRVETIGSVTMAGGMKSFSISTVANPKAYREVFTASMKAMTAADSPFNMFKDVKVTPDALTYEGFSFSKVEMALDFDKIAKLQPNNPGMVPMMKAMYGGDKLTAWFGVKDKQLAHIAAPSWDDAKSQLDTYLKGGDGVASTPGYKAIRGKLPEKASLLMLVSAQGLIKQIVAQFGAMGLTPDAKPPTDLPKEPALFGGSLTPVAPNGYEFHFIVPSAVGPVFEKGLVPVFSGIKPPGNP